MPAWDGAAWLAMMETFYPAVTQANIERAYVERTAYFGGAELIGRRHDALRFPDGTIVDVAFDSWTSRSRWQVLYVDPNAPPPEDDPFALEPGPLEELALPDVAGPPETAFTTRLAQALIELGAPDDALQGAALTLATAGASTGLADGLQQDLERARVAHNGETLALDALRPEEIVAATQGGDGIADARPGMPDDGDGAAPPEMEPGDPGPPPPDEGRPPEA